MDSKRDATRVVLLSLIFLFLFEMITEMMAAIYNLNLLKTELNENALGVAFLLAPVVLIFLRRGGVPKLLLLVTGEGVAVCRIILPFLPVTGMMLIGGLGTGCTLIYILATICDMSREGNPGEKGQAWALSLAIGVGSLILARALDSSVDGVMFGPVGWIGWVLGALAAVLVAQHALVRNVRAGSTEANPVVATSTTPESIPTIKARFRKRLALAAGFVGILLLMYMIFTSPSVLARWVDANYLAVVVVLVGAIAVAIIVLLAAPSLVNKVDSKTFKIWNVAFVVALVLTIVVNMGLDQSIQPPLFIGLQQLPLYAMLVLLPILFIDFAVVVREFLACKPTLPQLGTVFTVGGGYMILIILGAVFTIVWDYIPDVGPIFKDMLWAVMLIIGAGATVPVLLVQRGPLRFGGVSLGAGGGTARSRVRLGIAILLVAGIAGGSIASAAWLSPAPANPGSPAIVKLLTYNIQQGADAYGNTNFDQVLAVLQSADADIIALQESDTQRVSSGNRDITRYLADHLNMYAWFAPKTVTGTFGLSLLSKFPIEDAQAFYMPSTGEQTATIQAKITIGTRTFNVFVTHLGNGGAEYPPILERTDMLSNVILMGDFNFRNGSTQYNAVTATGLNSAWALKWGTGPDDTGYWGYTSDSLDPHQIIDHIFVSSPGIIVQDCHVLHGTTSSDHFAVTAEISV